MSDYSDVEITLVEFDELVRRCPGMYFSVSRGDPQLPTLVLTGVLRMAAHPAASLAEDHEPMVVVEVTSDMSYTVVDDQATPFDPFGDPLEGLCGSLLGHDRWVLAAALSLSTDGVIEVWRDGGGWRQEMRGLRPASPAVRFAASPGCGTRVVVNLDPDYCGYDVSLATNLSSVAVHGPDCARDDPSHVIVRDWRAGDPPAELRLG